ncbi:hypothetical protein M3Y94_00240600 [Aphelenchoides besseyi]|nr:hypothetical protein M3Y94_00240600 [Aphelenchoides besseyi]KAI6236354.1 hypothetical protein M3Y95_00148400 [Aphelenchoides besseyi]
MHNSTSIRGLRQQNQNVDVENDTFCLMSLRMRWLCMFLTLTLMASLLCAIVNSMHTSNLRSATYCKQPNATFTPDSLCPLESIVVFYECCSNDAKQLECCTKPKLLMIAAVVNMILALLALLCYCLKSKFFDANKP